MNDYDSPRRPSPDSPPYREWLGGLYEQLRTDTKRLLKRFPTVTRWANPDDILNSAATS